MVPEYNKLFFKRNILYPPLPQRPFVTVWNIDTSECQKKYNVTINLQSFDIVINNNQTRNGDKMVIFYSNNLGLYPNFDSSGNPVNGGIPQLGNLTAHLNKCIKDIETFIPHENFSGLAVIDWESWRPLWAWEGWGSGLIYQTASIKKVQKDHPDWHIKNITEQAQKEFESAAKSYMLQTVKLARSLRPKAQWGFYLFPDCYNYAKNGSDFTCHNDTIIRNNKIEWLFTASTGLYPSTYLGTWFKNQSTAIDYTTNRINEAKRVDANRYDNITIPIYVYNNLVYRETREFLLYQDVKHSSGIAAMLGASGVVLWGDYMDNSKDICMKLSKYVNVTLGPYLKALSDEASKCSEQLCSGHGRCVLTPSEQKPHTKKIYLNRFFFQFVSSNMFSNDCDILCQCYPGFSGQKCEFPQKADVQ